jgi:hypothetical protein
MRCRNAARQLSILGLSGRPVASDEWAEEKEPVAPSAGKTRSGSALVGRCRTDPHSCREGLRQFALQDRGGDGI